MGVHGMVCAIGLFWPLMSDGFTIPQAQRWGGGGWGVDVDMEHSFKETRPGISGNIISLEQNVISAYENTNRNSGEALSPASNRVPRTPY